MITACDLVRASRLREGADVDVLDVSARDGKGNEVFRLAGGRAGMTANAAGVIDYLGPLDSRCLDLLRLEHERSVVDISGLTLRAQTITRGVCYGRN